LVALSVGPLTPAHLPINRCRALCPQRFFVGCGPAGSRSWWGTSRRWREAVL